MAVRLLARVLTTLFEGVLEEELLELVFVGRAVIVDAKMAALRKIVANILFAVKKC